MTKTIEMIYVRNETDYLSLQPVLNNLDMNWSDGKSALSYNPYDDIRTNGFVRTDVFGYSVSDVSIAEIIIKVDSQKVLTFSPAFQNLIEKSSLVTEFINHHTGS